MTLLLYLEGNCLPLNFPSGSLLSAQETGRAQGKMQFILKHKRYDESR